MHGHHSFDHTTHEGNLWLHKVAERLALTDRRLAYSALRATLHALRDQLMPQSAVHLSAQLPMVVRGLFFEGWRLSGTVHPERTVEAFSAHLADGLPLNFPLAAQAVAEGVFDVIWSEIDPGETAKIIDQLPPPLRSLWPREASRGLSAI